MSKHSCLKVAEINEAVHIDGTTFVERVQWKKEKLMRQIDVVKARQVHNHSMFLFLSFRGVFFSRFA